MTQESEGPSPVSAGLLLSLFPAALEKDQSPHPPPLSRQMWGPQLELSGAGGAGPAQQSSCGSGGQTAAGQGAFLPRGLAGGANC